MKKQEHYQTNDLDAYELRCYNEIIDYFLKENRDLVEVELWRDMKLIELMGKLKRNKALKHIITKAIIILNALSYNYPSDTSNFFKNSHKTMSIKEKQIFHSTLKKELLIT
ncbi:MAG: hypothetical protein ACFFAS_16815 [Promethearchaeota archaeon]